MISNDFQARLNSAGVQASFVSDDQVLPLVITPLSGDVDLNQMVEQQQALMTELLAQYGGLLFRGFNVDSSDAFEQFVEKASGTPLKYTEQSSPRSNVGGRVYTSTDHPPDKEIFLHSEQSYNLAFPLKIFFFCETAAEKGGTTPIADARKIFNRISEQTREQFLQRKYRYSRYFWPMMSMTWQKAFQTDNQQEVEEYCRANQIEFSWEPGGALSTYQVRPVASVHPVSGDVCWFNHCTFFNLSTLDPDTKEMFEDSFSESELPNQTFYGDGGRIEEDVYNELRDAYVSEKVEFDWETGDVLMLDNMLCTHGRGSFEGERRVLTAMSEPTLWADVEYKPGA